MVVITTSYTDYTTSKHTWVYINNHTCSNSQQINIIRLFWCHCPPSSLIAVNDVLNIIRDLTEFVQNQLSNYSVYFIQLFLRFICMHFEMTHAPIRWYGPFTQKWLEFVFSYKINKAEVILEVFNCLVIYFVPLQQKFLRQSKCLNDY